jgi:hypothetical protein
VIEQQLILWDLKATASNMSKPVPDSQMNPYNEDYRMSSLLGQYLSNENENGQRQSASE